MTEETIDTETYIICFGRVGFALLHTLINL